MIASVHGNRSHIKTRVRKEQAIGVLKQRFRYLLIPLRTDLNNSLLTIVATMCLHNFALKRREQNYLDVEDDLHSTFQQSVTTRVGLNLNLNPLTSSS